MTPSTSLALGGGRGGKGGRRVPQQWHFFSRSGGGEIFLGWRKHVLAGEEMELCNCGYGACGSDRLALGLAALSRQALGSPCP